MTSEEIERQTELLLWQRFAAYCRSCALSGEHDPHDFEAFAKMPCNTALQQHQAEQAAAGFEAWYSTVEARRWEESDKPLRDDHRETWQAATQAAEAREAARPEATEGPIPEQVGLDELRESLWKSDPLNIVNAFMRIPSADVPMLHPYWERRLCALAEFIYSELQTAIDPPVCRLQFPDGAVPSDAREAAEGWHRFYGREAARVAEFRRRLEFDRGGCVPHNESTKQYPSGFDRAIELFNQIFAAERPGSDDG